MTIPVFVYRSRRGQETRLLQRDHSQSYMVKLFFTSHIDISKSQPIHRRQYLTNSSSTSWWNAVSFNFPTSRQNVPICCSPFDLEISSTLRVTDLLVIGSAFATIVAARRHSSFESRPLVLRTSIKGDTRADQFCTLAPFLNVQHIRRRSKASSCWSLFRHSSIASRIGAKWSLLVL